MMNKKENGKCRWMLTVALILLALFASERAHAYICYYYAVLDGTTLTIKGTEQRLETNSFTIQIYDSSYPSVNISHIVDPDFYDKVKKIIIKPNVANAAPRMFEYCRFWFQTMRNLAEIEGLKYINTSAVKDMSSMFCHCNNLKSLDLSAFDTSNVTNMEDMFMFCDSLKELDLSTFNTSKVTNMHQMFYGCEYLKKIKVDNFDTSNVTDMSYMFYKCWRLNDVDVSNFNTSNVTTMSKMFYDCENLRDIDVSGWNTSKVKDMSSMFYFTGLRKIDLSCFNVSNVTTMERMFYDCHYLTTIYCNDTWSCANSANMFAYCYVLEGAKEYSEKNKNDITYANPSNGYFTYKDYDVWIAGTRLTHTNYNNISSISGVTGGVSYEPLTKTITLNNATIRATASGARAIFSSEKKLNIKVVGTNTLTSVGSSAIVTLCQVVNITGDGSLTATGMAGIQASNDDYAENVVIIDGGVQLTAEGSNYGILGALKDDAYLTTLYVKGNNTSVRIKGTTQSLFHMGNVVLGDKLAINTPAEANFDSDSHTFVINGTAVANEWVEIGIKRYGVEVGGVPVTVANCSNITGSTITGGTAAYDDATNTLTLTDCSISYSGGVAIKSEIDSLNVRLVGNNGILAATGLESSSDFTILGDGQLAVFATTGINMINSMRLGELAICDGATVNIVAGETGISGACYKAVTPKIYRKTFRVSGGSTDVVIFASTAAVADMNKLVLKDGLALTAPTGAQFKNHAVCDADGNVVTNKTVRISLLGDANGDGSVTMADANMVVNYFLATKKSDIHGFDHNNANVNGDADEDGQPIITMADANMIVNMFLNSGQ